MPDKEFKQIVILSGKGGTGKTTITAGLAGLIDSKVVIDCDVDAANLHLVLRPEVVNSYNYYGGKKAAIDSILCTQCGKCVNACRFDAIKDFKVDPLSCEGCGFCYRMCPENAIRFEPVLSGTYFECNLPDKSKFYYARLTPGEGNSGKLVSEIKKRALENMSYGTEWVIIDGPPGIGCPVNASLSAADYAVIVTEPTLSGLHDLKRLVELLGTFKIPSGIIINKYDLNENITSRIFKYTESLNIPVLGSIPFNQLFVEYLIQGKNLIEENEKIHREFLSILKKIEIQFSIYVN